MTADEIRAEARENIQDFNRRGGTPGSDALLLLLYGMATEIAAQLAEINDRLYQGSYSIEVFGALGEP